MSSEENPPKVKDFSPAFLFPRVYAIGPNCTAHPLTHVDDFIIDKLLADDLLKNCHGVPTMVDSQYRVWPLSYQNYLIVRTL
jgi:hypothetical protein